MSKTMIDVREMLIKGTSKMMREEFFNPRIVKAMGGEEYITFLLHAICEEASKCFPYMEYQVMSFDSRTEIRGDDDYRV